jgi:hypothetical protein
MFCPNGQQQASTSAAAYFQKAMNCLFTRAWVLGSSDGKCLVVRLRIPMLAVSRIVVTVSQRTVEKLDEETP